MYICVYVYVYVYIYMYAFVYIFMYKCVCVYMYICIYVYMYICIYVYTHARTRFGYRSALGNLLALATAQDCLGQEASQLVILFWAVLSCKVKGLLFRG